MMPVDGKASINPIPEVVAHGLAAGKVGEATRVRSVRIQTVIWKPYMTEIYLHFLCAYYELYPNAPVIVVIVD